MAKVGPLGFEPKVWWNLFNFFELNFSHSFDYMQTRAVAVSVRGLSSLNDIVVASKDFRFALVLKRSWIT